MRATYDWVRAALAAVASAWAISAAGRLLLTGTGLSLVGVEFGMAVLANLLLTGVVLAEVARRRLGWRPATSSSFVWRSLSPGRRS